MNWSTIIQSIIDSGMTQAQIAEACDTGQSHISGLYRGDRKQPNWALGNRLLALYRERCDQPATVLAEKRSSPGAKDRRGHERREGERRDSERREGERRGEKGV